MPDTLTLPATRPSPGIFVLNEPRLPSSTDARQIRKEASADFALTQTIRQTLCATGYPALCGLDVAVQGSAVHLRGFVPSYYQKQLALAAVRRIAGACQIGDGIAVISGR